jgi:hypothetical protein
MIDEFDDPEEIDLLDEAALDIEDDEDEESFDEDEEEEEEGYFDEPELFNSYEDED